MDDLLDLSWQPTQTKPQSSSSSSFNNNTTTNSALASPSSKPNYYGSSSTSTSASASNNAAASKTTAAHSDAFSSLFSSSSTAKQQANLSLAQRQKLASEQALRKAQDEKRRNDALWSGIESASFGGSAPSRQQPPSATWRLNSPAPTSAAPSNTASNSSTQAAQDPWDFDAFSSALPSKSTSTASKPTSTPTSSITPPNAQLSNDPFDFDSFDSPFDAPKLALDTQDQDHVDDILGALAMPVSDAPKQSLSPLDPRVAALSSSTSTSSAGSSRVPSPASGTRPVGGRSTPAARSSSPPPHVIGQIVEMGFSPQEARRALAQTETGVNVEAALELLIGSGNASHQTHEDDERLARKLQAREHSQAQSQSTSFRDSDDQDDAQHMQHREQHHHPRHPEQRGTHPRAPGRATPNPDGDAAADWQQQADQLYAQASEIGTSVLNKASAFWSSAKAQAQKALDERNRAAAERSTTPSDAGSERHRARRWGAASAGAGAARTKEWEGKPKWMIDAERAQEAESGTASNQTSADVPMAAGGFKDSDHEDDEPAQQVPEPPTRAPRRPAAPAAGVAAAAAAMSSAASALWGGKAEDNPQHVPRHQSPSQASPSVPARSAASAGIKAPYASPNRRGPTRSAAPSPIPPKTSQKRRPIPSDASHSISSANRNKQEGNDHFRRGAYGDAETSYTRGISALESSSSDSIRLVPLLSNRANVRLKNGDAAGTIADCDQLLTIILSLFGGSQRDANGKIAVYRASQEAALPAELAEINLRETYGKALVRRAQALEASERWKQAKADWEVLLEYEKAEGSGVKTATSNMKFAREGLYRCGKMLGEKVVGSAVSSGATLRSGGTRTRTRLEKSGEEKASEAFANQQVSQAAEANAKFQLKDSVDAKIDAWKKGKETNLRALLCSLDTIVWPELGWKPIALHQVLDQAGLKKNYTKAIARLHPDKLKKEATIEQKMIANAAFAVLNDAWNSQQQ
ncbi:related to SWA2 - Auxilin-like protein involved in vesicular transport [Ustilago trichophora]|uniref:Related to SWA2 - Auxilin-like protein involved in vesicular transport n=1 Tax=Ustilago trichophora TaxID=86804 RepID=A0A5C3ELS5_9BASI|nr:related to SWA2 - Auxilin-like protein involved in vesicular transport [Ustilago trichophora]